MNRPHHINQRVDSPLRIDLAKSECMKGGKKQKKDGRSSIKNGWFQALPPVDQTSGSIATSVLREWAIPENYPSPCRLSGNGGCGSVGLALRKRPLTGQFLPGFLLWTDCLGFCGYLGEAVGKPVQKATVRTLGEVAAEHLQYVLSGAQGINQAR